MPHKDKNHWFMKTRFSVADIPAFSIIRIFVVAGDRILLQKR
jgi:hypothetical protein